MKSNILLWGVILSGNERSILFFDNNNKKIKEVKSRRIYFQKMLNQEVSLFGFIDREELNIREEKQQSRLIKRKKL